MSSEKFVDPKHILHSSDEVVKSTMEERFHRRQQNTYLELKNVDPKRFKGLNEESTKDLNSIIYLVPGITKDKN